MRHRPILVIGVPIVVAILMLCPLVPISAAPTDQERGASVQRASVGHVRTSLAASVREGATVAWYFEAMILLMCAVGAGLIVAGIEAVDLWRERRAEEAATLHARMLTAIQRDRSLKDLAVTPFVRLPLWGRSGTIVEMRGAVPTLWLRYAVMRLAEQEAAAFAAAYRMIDRLTIISNPEMETTAA